MDTLKQSAKNILEIQSKFFIIIILCSIFLTSLLPMSLVYGADTSYIYGYVTDEDGAVLNGVTVQLISGGAVLDSCKSNSNGYFYMKDVEYVTCTIKFSKSGYAETTDSLTIKDSDTNVGTVTLLRALRLSTSTLDVVIEPDTQVNIPFTVQNLGEETEIVDLTASNPNEWSTRILTDNYEVTKVSIASGQSLTLQLEVSVPATAVEETQYTVSLTAEGTTEGTLTFSVLARTPATSTDDLSLSSSIFNTVANSGEKLVLPFSTSNTGDETEVVAFSVTAPEDWTVKILDDNGREINSVTMESDAILNFNLEVTIPLDYTGDTTLTLTATGTTTDTLDFMLTVEPMSEPILFCQFPGKWAIPGDTVSFQTKLTNPFGVEMRFEISVASVPSNWTAYLKTESGEYVTEIILDSGESVNLVVEVESSDSSLTGEKYDVTILAESTDQTVTDSLSLVVALNDPDSDEEIKITAKFRDVNVEAGETVEYDITVTNLGDTDRLLYLSIDQPADWKAVFKSGAVEITALDIEAGTSETLTVEVTPPTTVSLDSYEMPVQFLSESGTLFGEITLKATIGGAYDLSLDLSTLLTSATSGGSTSFTATVTNTGYSYVTAASLDIEVEDDWDVTISPAQVSTLNSQESYTFDVTIDTPEGTVSGDYMVTLSAISDQSESAQSQVRVTVTTSTEWGIYGIAVAAILVVVLVLVFKKFKRR
ncbi:MAG: NEW3 domain-containing protein [Candidatus Bathyarchaeota archaeon]|nr:NEW3 domain-containing protein [Candidatus Bathyarchaeum sp.]